jgi:NAD(P)-dependent dehydrogenase (short-subunit alcohol dehydrogenase family)
MAAIFVGRLNGGLPVVETRSSERVALITGANKGIGFETARQLGKQSITVLVGFRDKQRGQKSVETLRGEGINAQGLILDVTSQSTIDAAASHVDREFGKLDILVNNAGILAERVFPSECQVENLRKTFETNFFGLFAVTKAFLPLIRKAPAGRIVNLSSGLASLTNLSDPERFENTFLAYSASKVAVNVLTIGFARELRDTAIKVNSVAPGYVATDMNNLGGHLTVEEGAVVPVRLATLSPDGPTGSFIDVNGTVPW